MISIDTRAARSSASWLESSSLALLEDVIGEGAMDRVAVVSSFGAESAVLLHLVAQVNRKVPVLFVDTRMLFVETLIYQRKLAASLGLQDVRVVRADPAALAARDGHGTLRKRDPDACCALRKAEPLHAALEEFDVWINGRKRFQTGTRAAMQPVEADGQGRLKINPLLHWTAEDIAAAMQRWQLPAHPLVGEGYTSIGCAPCTAVPAKGADPRSGRWAGQAKSECGIHTDRDAPSLTAKSIGPYV